MKVKRKTKFARQLRNEPTDAEKLLWLQLRKDQLGFRFRRQLAIGAYIVDFACPVKNIIIELDGGQHVEQVAYDHARTEFLESQGYKVLRFWSNDILDNIEGVLQVIVSHLE